MKGDMVETCELRTLDQAAADPHTPAPSRYHELPTYGRRIIRLWGFLRELPRVPTPYRAFDL